MKILSRYKALYTLTLFTVYFTSFHLNGQEVVTPLNPNCFDAVLLTCDSDSDNNRDLRDESNNFEREDFINCSLPSGVTFQGKDKIYRFIKESSNDKIELTLSHGTSINLSMFILDACQNEVESSFANVNCIDRGQNTTSGNQINGEVWSDNGNLPVGTYYVVIDAVDQSEEGVFSLTLKCSSLDCSDYRDIACYEDDTWNNGEGESNVSQYRRGSTTYHSLTGPEVVYRIRPDRTEEYTFRLTDVASGRDLDMFLLDDCDPEAVLMSSDGLSSDEFTFELRANREYWLVVDGENGSVSDFTLSVSCPCKEDGVLDCGENRIVMGSNRNAINSVKEVDRSCRNSSSSTELNARDQVYKFTSPESKEYIFRMYDLSADLDLYFMKDCQDPSTCVELPSTKTGSSSEESKPIFIEEGESIFVVVDAQNSSRRSDFTLEVICEKSNDETCGNCFSYLPVADNTIEIDLRNAYCPDCPSAFQTITVTPASPDGFIDSLLSMDIPVTGSIIEFDATTYTDIGIYDFLICYSAGCNGGGELLISSGLTIDGHISEGGDNYYCCILVKLKSPSDPCRFVPIPHVVKPSIQASTFETYLELDASYTIGGDFFSWDLDEPSGIYYGSIGQGSNLLRLPDDVMSTTHRPCLIVANSCGMAKYCFDYNGFLAGDEVECAEGPTDYPQLEPIVSVNRVSFNLLQGDLSGVERVEIDLDDDPANSNSRSLSVEEFLNESFTFSPNTKSAHYCCIKLYYGDCFSICICYTIYAEPLACEDTYFGTTIDGSKNFDATNFDYSCFPTTTNFTFEGPDDLIPFEKKSNNPVLITLTQLDENGDVNTESSANLSMFLLESDGTPLSFLQPTETELSCKGSNFSVNGGTAGETLTDESNPIPPGDYLILVEGSSEGVASHYRIDIECDDDCIDISNQDWCFGYRPTPAFEQSGEYTIDFITQDAPAEVRSANLSSITWKVDDSVIGTGESFTYRPNGPGTVVICVEWRVPGVEGGPDRCYRFCKRICFDDPFDCDTFWWYPSDNDGDLYTFQTQQVDRVVSWELHDEQGTIEYLIGNHDAVDIDVSDERFPDDCFWMTLTYWDGNCLKVCCKKICISDKSCGYDLIRPIFTGSEEEVLQGNYIYSFESLLPQGQELIKWKWYPISDPTALTESESQNVTTTLTANPESSQTIYRICILYIENGCYKLCCIDVCLRNPYSCGEETIDVQCSGEGYDLESLTNAEILYWVDDNGDIIEELGNDPNPVGYLPPNPNSRFIYCYYRDCDVEAQVKGEDNKANTLGECWISVCCYPLPDCRDCYDNCCEGVDDSWLDEYKNADCDCTTNRIYQSRSMSGSGPCTYKIEIESCDPLIDDNTLYFDCAGVQLGGGLNDQSEYDLIWNCNSGDLPECKNCYTSCCQNEDFIDSYIDSLDNLECTLQFPSVCPYDYLTIYQCFWRGQCVYRFETNDPGLGTITGDVRDCNGELLFLYALPAANMEEFEDLQNCEVIWSWDNGRNNSCNRCEGERLLECSNYNDFAAFQGQNVSSVDNRWSPGANDLVFAEYPLNNLQTVLSITFNATSTYFFSQPDVSGVNFDFHIDGINKMDIYVGASFTLTDEAGETIEILFRDWESIIGPTIEIYKNGSLVANRIFYNQLLDELITVSTVWNSNGFQLFYGDERVYQNVSLNTNTDIESLQVASTTIAHDLPNYISNICLFTCGEDDCPPVTYNDNCNLLAIDEIEPSDNENYFVSVSSSIPQESIIEYQLVVEGSADTTSSLSPFFFCPVDRKCRIYVLYRDENGCITACCINIEIPFHCDKSFEPLYTGDGFDLSYSFIPENSEIQPITYFIQEEGSQSVSPGQSYNFSAPGEYTICMLYYDAESRCYRICCKRVCIDFPFDGIKELYISAEEYDDGTYYLSLNGDDDDEIEILSWRIDSKRGTYIGNHNPQLFDRNDFNISDDEEILICVRYIDANGCVKVCCIRLCPTEGSLLDPDYEDCDLIDLRYKGPGLVYELCYDGGRELPFAIRVKVPRSVEAPEMGDRNKAQIVIDPDILPQDLETGCYIIDLEDFRDLEEDIIVCFEYIDENGCLRECCKKICAFQDPTISDACNNIDWSFSNSQSTPYLYNFHLNVSDVDTAYVEWTIHDNIARRVFDIEGGTDISVDLLSEEYGFRVGDKVCITVEYFNPITRCFELCCICICIQNPYECGLIDHSVSEDELSLAVSASSSEEIWYTEDGTVISSTTSISDLPNIDNKVVICVRYFDTISNCFRVCCKEICISETTIDCNDIDVDFAVTSQGVDISVDNRVMMDVESIEVTTPEGSVISLDQTSQSFDMFGNYKVCVIFINDCGELQSCCFERCVAPPLDCSPFDYEIRINDNNQVSFDYIGVSSITNTFWSFGDGSAENRMGASTTHQYPAKGGEFTVCIILYNECFQCRVCITIDIPESDDGCCDNEDLVLRVEEICGNSGQTVMVPVYATNFNNIDSMTMTIELSQDIGRIVRITPSELPDDRLSHLLFDNQTAIVRMRSEGPPLSVSTNDPLFNIEVEIDQGTIENSDIIINSAIEPFALFDTQGQRIAASSVAGSVCRKSTNIVFGRVLTSLNNGIANVDLSIRGTSFTALSDQNGLFQLEVPSGGEIVVEAEKEDSYLNGVTPQDILLLKRHLNAVTNGAITDPYTRIAADVNDDKMLTPVDVLEMRALILGNSNSFTNNLPWRFPIAGQSFDPFNAFDVTVPDYNDVFIESSFIRDQSDVDFIGVKIGDLNGTANISSIISSTTRSSLAEDILIRDAQFNQGDTVQFSLESTEVYLKTSLILELGFTESLQFIGLMSSDLPDVSYNNIGQAFINEGKLIFLWTDDSGNGFEITENSNLMTLQFVATAEGTLSEVFGLSNMYRSNQYTDENLDVSDVSLVYDKSTSILESSSAQFDISIIPNPFSQQASISINSSVSTDGNLDIYNSQGKLIGSENLKVLQGKNSFGLNSSILTSNYGLFYYNLTTKEGTYSGRFIRIQ